MSPCFVLGRENVPCVAEVVNRSLKADCTDFKVFLPFYERSSCRAAVARSFPSFSFAYSYRLFKKFNRAPLKYSLGALFRFPGGYTHAALETI